MGRSTSGSARTLGALLALACVACTSLRSSVEIDAPAERVWAIATDLGHYHDWNPFFVCAQGKLAEGESLELTLQPVGQSSRAFSPTVLTVAPKTRFAWRGRLVMPGLFDGTHQFLIEPLSATRTRFTQEESFSGILVPFVGFDPYRAGWERMNRALKTRAEKASR